jgi:hypothetical protein
MGAAVANDAESKSLCSYAAATLNIPLLIAATLAVRAANYLLIERAFPAGNRKCGKPEVDHFSPNVIYCAPGFRLFSNWGSV